MSQIECGTSKPQENKMGVMPVPQLIFNMSMPMILSMLVQACYNIVDSYFVAKISQDALTAVSLAFPIQSLMISVASGTAVGVNALLSRSLGEKNMEAVNKTANNSILLTIISFLVFALIGIFGSHAFFASQVDKTAIIEAGESYLQIVCGCSVGIFFQITLDRLLQSTGRTLFTMFTQGTGAIINIILDPILIFGLCGMPKMGVAGAAAATVIGQIIAAIMGLIFNLKFNPEIKLSIKMLRFDPQIIKTIYAVGFPSILMMSIGSVMTFGFNKILLMFTDTAATVFGVYFKLQSFFFMPIFGLNNGIVPIIAYNYGASKKDRIIKTIKIGCITSFCMMMFGLALFHLVPEQLLKIFEASDEMIAIGTVALKTISYSYLLAGFCIVIGSVFQAMGNGFYSLIVSVCRQLLVLLPAAYFLAVTLGLNAVWWSFPIAEIMSFAVTMILFRKIYHDKISRLN